MTLKKELNKSTAKATAAAQADESEALKNPAKATQKPAKSADLAPKSQAAAKPKVKSGAATKIESGAAAKKAKKSAPSKKSSPAREAKLPDAAQAPKTQPKSKGLKTAVETTSARVLDSQVAYEGPLFRVLRDHLVEPGGRESHRDVIRHNGSVVILAINHDHKKGKKGGHKKDPWVVIERQYRHAAGQFLWELPAGKLDSGEEPLDGAKRELAEETGYQAENWSPLVEYYASPGFLGEAMKIFLAEGLIAGDAHPEEDEHIDFRLVRLSEILQMIDKGKIIDGKTLTSVLLYARQLGIKKKK